LLRILSLKKTFVPPIQPIKFDTETLSKPKDISEKFIRQFVPKPKYSVRSRLIQRQLHKTHPLDHEFMPFTAAMTTEAIACSNNSTTTGPDGLTSLHLKHLGQSGINYLTELLNLSVRDAVIPVIWKTALVLPIPKAEKLADQGLSYRPISLLSPAIKILERLLLPTLTISLQAALTQHGFRMDRSTITALLPMSSAISEGFNCDKTTSRTAWVAIDISKAFDTVDISLLLKQISASDLHHNYVRCLSSYL
jgi:hypothetical protein